MNHPRFNNYYKQLSLATYYNDIYNKINDSKKRHGIQSKEYKISEEYFNITTNNIKTIRFQNNQDESDNN